MEYENIPPKLDWHYHKSDGNFHKMTCIGTLENYSCFTKRRPTINVCPWSIDTRNYTRIDNQYMGPTHLQESTDNLDQVMILIMKSGK